VKWGTPNYCKHEGFYTLHYCRSLAALISVDDNVAKIVDIAPITRAPEQQAPLHMADRK
jgi:hypothetical protein